MLYLNTSSKTPLYQQIYDDIRARIISGELESGCRLASLREYAKIYCVSRNTVENAYSQLCCEGYIQNRPGSGYYVIPTQKTRFISPNMPPLEKDSDTKIICEREFDEEVFSKYDFQYSHTNSELFSAPVSEKYIRRVYNSRDWAKIDKQDELQGDYALREEISKYLRLKRGIACTPEQIFINSGTQASMETICQIIDPKNRIIAMEDPSYDLIRNIMLNNSFEIIPITVENDGVNVNEIVDSKAKLAYVTPSHQFPMGGIMSLEKRTNLLTWAKSSNTYIIENDFDSEFVYEQQPTPSLYSLDPENRVIYLGTFSRIFSPEFYMSYIILPLPLMIDYYRIFKSYHCNVSLLEQKIMCEFMKGKFWNNYLRRMNSSSTRKHDILVNSIEEYFCGQVIVHGTHSGMHILLEFKDDRSITKLIDKALEGGVRVYPIHKYWFQKENYKNNQILIGYAGISEKDIDDGIKILAKIWSTLG